MKVKEKLEDNDELTRREQIEERYSQVLDKLDEELKHWEGIFTGLKQK